jgi:hypothetical protein
MRWLLMEGVRAMNKDEFLGQLGMVATSTGREDWHGREFDSWDVGLSWDGRFLNLPYRMGLAFEGKQPTVEQVLGALRSDCSMLATLGEETFEQWCLEFGFNPDSITELRMFESVVQERDDIRELFAGDYEAFMELFEEEW